MFDVEEFLSHYGVKGMRWGVRKGSVNAKSAARVDPAKDATDAAALKTKVRKGGTKTLSNQEMKELTARLKLEQEANQLLTKERSKVRKGHETVKYILAVGATMNAVATFHNTPMGKMVAENLMRGASAIAVPKNAANWG